MLDYEDARNPSRGLWLQVDSGSISIPDYVATKLRFTFLGCYVDDVELWAGW